MVRSKIEWKCLGTSPWDRPGSMRDRIRVSSSIALVVPDLASCKENARLCPVIGRPSHPGYGRTPSSCGQHPSESRVHPSQEHPSESRVPVRDSESRVRPSHGYCTILCSTESRLGSRQRRAMAWLEPCHGYVRVMDTARSTEPCHGSSHASRHRHRSCSITLPLLNHPAPAQSPSASSSASSRPPICHLFRPHPWAGWVLAYSAPAPSGA
jgi:hypothetical protein